MHNAFAQPQTILLLGGTSDIGLAIVRALVSPTCHDIVLACRNPSAADEAVASLRADGRNVTAVRFDASQPATHAALITDVVSRVGDIDLVIMAFGVLGDQGNFDQDAVAAAEAVTVNYVGGVSSGLAVAAQFRKQGHGRLVVLSSVAGERTRKSNFVYGSSKAGIDAFAQGLGDSLVGTGATVLIVRPGFVHSAMTAGLAAVPFSTTPEAVAEATVRGLHAAKRTVWAPGILRYVFMILRHLPGAVFRRLPLG